MMHRFIIPDGRIIISADSNLCVPGDIGWVFNDMIIDWCDYAYELPMEAIMKVLQGAPRAIGLYNYYKPSTPEERRIWYRNSTAHIYEGINWHTDPPSHKYREAIAMASQGKTLCFGCGIGTEGIIAAARGREVSFYDVNIKAMEYVLYRLAKHELEGKVYTNIDSIPKGYFDTVICIDVLEHVEDPKATLMQIKSFMKPEGKLLIEAPFQDTSTPEHLEKNKGFWTKDLCAEVGITQWMDGFIREPSEKIRRQYENSGS